MARKNSTEAARAQAVASLVEVGLAGLEAEVYVFLLGEPGATGYRVAQAIGKPTANTYKAIAALEKKGAVLVDDGTTRVCRAVPWQTLLARHAEQQRQRLDTASSALARLGTSNDDDDDDGLYRLRSVDAVLEVARRIVREARDVVLAVLGPSLLPHLHTELAAAAARGVDVAVKSYGPFAIPGVQCVSSNQAADASDFAIGEELQLAVDGTTCVIAFVDVDADETAFALWTENRVVALSQFNHLSVEITFTELARGVLNDAPSSQLRTIIDRVRYVHVTRGARELAPHRDALKR